MWKVTVHYEAGDHVNEYQTLADALQWSGQAIRQMGWPNSKHNKVTIECLAKEDSLSGCTNRATAVTLPAASCQ